jgi:hypothetical protein
MLLSRGNKKLGENVLCWSLPPVKTCLNCKDCSKTCYAMKSYRLYPTVKKCWDNNHLMVLNGEFKNQMIKEIAYREGSFDTIRIHVAGDFFNQSYINDWSEIISIFPKITFYTYTKVYELLDFSGIEKNRNFNLINSITPMGINFGSFEYCKLLQDTFDYKICPAFYYKNIKCGKDCKLCHTKKLITFVKH